MHMANKNTLGHSSTQIQVCLPRVFGRSLLKPCKNFKPLRERRKKTLDNVEKSRKKSRLLFYIYFIGRIPAFNRKWRANWKLNKCYTFFCFRLLTSFVLFLALFMRILFDHHLTAWQSRLLYMFVYTVHTHCAL